MELIGTTWTHQFNPTAPTLVVRKWASNPASHMVEVADATSGAWITRDYPALVIAFLERNWYARS